jgi:hypothetical protein
MDDGARAKGQKIAIFNADAVEIFEREPLAGTQ